MRVVALFNLKSGVDVAAYEDWARSRDLPGMRALPSIDDFRVYRTSGLLGGDGNAPFAYVQIIDIADLDGFGTDITAEASRQVAREFADYADGPVFMLTEQID